MNHPSDSQVTLVDTPRLAPPGENIILTFDKDDTMNTTLRICGNYRPSYFVETRDNTTAVYAGDLLIATISRKMFRRDQIRFPGLRPMNLGNWLKAPLFSTLPLTFHACGIQFEWRRDSSGQLVLHESSHPNDVVAMLSNSCTEHGNYIAHAAYLVIKPEMDEARDMIVLSCLLAEHKLQVVDMISAERRKAIMYSMMF